VINAEFQVIGQFESEVSSPSSTNAEFQVIGQFESEVSSPSSTNLKDDESAITPTDKEISLVSIILSDCMKWYYFFYQMSVFNIRCLNNHVQSH